jgi:hypothetical protein
MHTYRPILSEVDILGVPPHVTPTNRAILYSDTWHHHILKGHPELQGKESLVEEVVRRPSAIFASNTLSSGYIFVKASVTDFSGRLLRVVVRGGNIITAYFSSATGGRQLWP